MRFVRPIASACLLAALWGVSSTRLEGPRPWVHPLGSSGPVRILRFYASVGALEPGETAQLCYGVENAKSVRISPWVSGAGPAMQRCLIVDPQRTTHYTIVAEGYDGGLAVRSLTLPVGLPPGPERPLHFAIARWDAARRAKS
jgi:hypothetical protein